MHRSVARRTLGPSAALLAALLVASGCGSVQVSAKQDPDSAPSASPTAELAATDTAAGEGDWFLAVATAAGADGEASRTTYITYNPSTGAATAQEMPEVEAQSATPAQAALLVSSSRLYAIPDTGISPAATRSGRLKVYSLTSDTTTIIDMAERTDRDDVRPIAWAFDPAREDTLRVVDDKDRVWALNVAGGKATPETPVAGGAFVFLNGFNPTTGEPWSESIDSDETKPPGNGPADESPVVRYGGTVLPADSPGLVELPRSPCRLGAGFTTGAGVTWTFCADEASISTYVLAKDGSTWAPYGKPSAAVAPVASGFPLVLPPAE